MKLLRSEDVGRISIVDTLMKISSKVLTAEFTKYLDSEEAPDFDEFPLVQPSLVDEMSRMELAICEKLINDLGLLLDRDIRVLDRQVQDLDGQETFLFDSFERNFDGFCAMLDVAMRDANSEVLQEMSKSWLEMLSYYTGAVNENYQTIENDFMRHNQQFVIDSVLAPIVEALETQHAQYENLLCRQRAVNGLNAEEYAQATSICENLQRDIDQSNQSIIALDRGIMEIDQQFAALSQSINLAKIEKSNIKFDYEDINDEDGSLVEAQEQLQLIEKISFGLFSQSIMIKSN